jgi:hypothetical protein
MKMFQIRRDVYPKWFTGFNGYGPMWSSAQESAIKVPQELLWPTMLSLEAHGGICAFLVDKNKNN